MIEKTIQENLIKVSGKFPIEKVLELSEDVTIVIRGGIVKKEIFDNQDGTVNVVYVVKPLDMKVVKNSL